MARTPRRPGFGREPTKPSPGAIPCSGSDDGEGAMSTASEGQRGHAALIRIGGIAMLVGLAIHIVLNGFVKEFPPEEPTSAELQAYLNTDLVSEKPEIFRLLFELTRVLFTAEVVTWSIPHPRVQRRGPAFRHDAEVGRCARFRQRHGGHAVRRVPGLRDHRRPRSGLSRRRVHFGLALVRDRRYPHVRAGGTAAIVTSTIPSGPS